MTNDQFALLQHQISVGRRYSGMDTDLSRHNEKLAEALTVVLVERAELLCELKSLVSAARAPIHLIDASLALEFAADEAEAAVERAEGKS